MAEDHHQAPGLVTLAQKLVATGLGAVRNRAELLAVELQQERERLVEVLIMTAVLVFLAMMVVGLATGIIISLCPQSARLYVAGGLTLLYLGGAIWAGLTLRTLLKRSSFAETLNQFKKDREWLDSFK
jgi:uncharacterized membrane protein YqjE